MGETKYSFLDSNDIISYSVDKEVGNFIKKKHYIKFLRKQKIPWDFTP